MSTEKKKHWETVYETKTPDEVSWTQEIPKTSLDFIALSGLDKSAKIIDIGGGDSKLADFLLELGYENITILDISENALNRAKKRLGIKAEKINWIVSDITSFEPEVTYDIWHDRATFHFLTEESQIEKYLNCVQKAVTGHLIIGTFSKNGPLKCSNLNIQQYNEDTLTTTFGNNFEKIKCITEDHQTPFNTSQNFIFCSFKRV